MDDGYNIADNSGKKSMPQGKPFVKGDKRCWRKGRPRVFDAARKLAVELAREIVDDENGAQVSAIELILRRWRDSKSSQDNKLFVEMAYGKVPDKIEVASSITVKPPSKVENGDAEQN
jgi:ribosomal protein S14